MLKKVEGIIINQTNYGETSKIVNILTRDGIVGVIAKGAKSIKSPLRSSTLNLTWVAFLFMRIFPKLHEHDSEKSCSCFICNHAHDFLKS